MSFISRRITFNRLIKSKTGLTYSAYVQQIRLERAERLLLTTPKSIGKRSQRMSAIIIGIFL